MARCALAKSLSKTHWRALLAVIAFLLIPGIAPAVSFDLEVEFDTGLRGNFGVVSVVENGGDLDFDIQLDPSLGPDADLHVVYFNLLGTFTGLTLSTTDAASTPYQLIANSSVAGGAGSDFDYAVHFGNGAGRRGNGKLSHASFTLSADQPLAIIDLLENSFASGGSIEVNFAAHVQGTSLFRGADSETVGGLVPVPEPETASLLAFGILVLAARARSPRTASLRRGLPETWSSDPTRKLPQSVGTQE